MNLQEFNVKNLLRLTRFLIWNINRIFPFLRLRAHSVQGKFLIPREAIKANDYIHYSLYVNKCFEYDIYRRSVDFLKAKGFLKATGNILLDIGVNNGVITIGSIICKDFDYSFGVDGCADHIKSCRENLRLNQIEKSAKLFHCIVSDKKRKVSFQKSKTNFGQHCVSGEKDDFDYIFNEGSHSRVSAESTTLDTILEPHFSEIERGNSLLWIDVEGHEGFVFKGAKGILSKNLPCVMELCPYMIRRSGMEIEEYISIIQEYWNEFWIIREFKIVNYPTSVLRNFIDEFEEEGSYQNIILTS